MRVEELVRQVTVAQMQLHSVEACLERVASRAAKHLVNTGKLVDPEPSWDSVRLPVLPVDARRLTVRRTHRRGATEEVGVRDPPAVPELTIDVAASRVYGVGDALPALRLRLVLDMWHISIAIARGMDNGRFRENQAHSVRCA